jgi:hydroxyacylglutathione hydrolase
MSKKLRVTIPLVLVILMAAYVVKERRLLLIMAMTPSSSPLSEPAAQPESVTWFDDYFTIEYIDSKTIAIGEPRYYQFNYNYLILGEESAILFDTGAGVRDIKPVVESLTTLPVIVTQSHLHYDHVGNHKKFDRMAMPDLTYLRNKSQAGVLPLSRSEHLGFMSGFDAPDFAISEWWAPGSSVNLGGRVLDVIHTPGHTPDSIMLFDSERKLLFTGDYIYPGPLYGMAPGADLGDYLSTAQQLVDSMPSEAKLLGAHGETESSGLPILHHTDLVDLKNALEKILNGTLEGEGFYLQRYPVNTRIELWAD